MSSRSTRLRAAAVAVGIVLAVVRPETQSAPGPSIDDMLNLKRVGSPAISPNGQQVAYTIRETNWDENAYETEIWIGEAATGQSRQVTNAKKSSSQPAFSPDGAWLGFISDRDGKRQVYRIALRGGEAEKLTSTDDGVNNFCVVTRRQVDRIHDDRPGVGGDEGTREALGRHQDRGSGSALHASHRLRPRHEDRKAAHEGQFRRRQLRLVA